MSARFPIARTSARPVLQLEPWLLTLLEVLAALVIASPILLLCVLGGD